MLMTLLINRRKPKSMETVLQLEITFLNQKFNQNCQISALFGLQNPQKCLTLYG